MDDLTILEAKLLVAANKLDKKGFLTAYNECIAKVDADYSDYKATFIDRMQSEVISIYYDRMPDKSFADKTVFLNFCLDTIYQDPLERDYRKLIVKYNHTLTTSEERGTIIGQLRQNHMAAHGKNILLMALRHATLNLNIDEMANILGELEKYE